MDNKEINISDLTYTNKDRVVDILKGAGGAIPYGGALISEILGMVIPNQRLDRVVTFIEKLSNDFNDLSITIDELKVKLYEPEYSSLFYKACSASANSVDEDKIKYIKNLFKFGISIEKENAFQLEELIKIIDELNRVEILYLTQYFYMRYDFQKYKELEKQDRLEPIKPNLYLSMSQEEYDSEVVKEVYSNKLLRLGLFERAIDRKGKEKIQCSSLGSLFIRRILEICDN